MKRLRAWVIRLSNVFRTNRREDEIADELESHLEMQVADNVRAGMTPEEARRQALIKLGGLEQARETYRDRLRLPALDTFLQDLRYGLRVLARDRSFTVIAVVTLALGIAANSTIFTVANAWMLRPPRIKDPGRVVAVLTTDPGRSGSGWDQNAVSAPDFVAWRDESQSFERMVASERSEFALTGEGEPERIVGMRVSTDYFQMLGVDAALGRTFLPGEDQPGHAQVVILGQQLWQRRFGADPRVIGKAVRVDGESHTVIGIMPDHFRVGYYEIRLWVPLALPPERLVPAARADHRLDVLARLKPSVSVDAATAEMATLARRAENAHPGTTHGWGATAMVLQRYLADEFKLAMGIQMGSVVLVLLIACANIATLQLTRAAARQTELAVRAALGAGRFRLIRQLLLESLMVGVFGGGLGLILAWWGVTAFRSGLNWGDYVRAMALEITIDRNVIVFTVGITLGAAVLFGLVPAFHQAAVSPHSTLKEGGRTVSQSRTRRRALGLLVTAQIALSLALVVCAGIFVWDFLFRASRGLGIDPKQVLTADVRLTTPRYEDPVRQTAFFEEAVERLDALPGVVSAGATTALMHLDQARVVTFSLQGDAPLPRKDRFKTEYLAVSPRFLATLRVPLLRGRSLAPSDNAQALPVALVNQAFVRRYLRNDEPVGKHLRLDTSDSDRPDWSQIVGVVADVRELSDQWEVEPQVYEPWLQRPAAALTLVVRTTTSEPTAFAPLLRSTIWSIDRDQPISRVQTMEQVIADSRADGVMVTTLLGAYAGLALAMAMVGVFGVVAYTVTQRTHEIGIRMALGAQTSDVVRMVAGTGMVLGAVGVGIGLALAAPLVWLPTGPTPGMPLSERVRVVLAAGVLLWVAALLASYIPTRRATRIDPTVALRYE